jgi:hypothetical protein
MHHSLDPFSSGEKLSFGLRDQVMDTEGKVRIPSCPGLDRLGHHTLMQILGLQKSLSSRHADDDTSVVVVKVASWSEVVVVVVVTSSRVVSDADADADVDVVPMTVVGKQIPRRLALVLAKKGSLVGAVLEGAAKDEKRGIGKSGHVVISLGGGHAFDCTRRSSQTMRWWSFLPLMARFQGADLEVLSGAVGGWGCWA